MSNIVRFPRVHPGYLTRAPDRIPAPSDFA